MSADLEVVANTVDPALEPPLVYPSTQVVDLVLDLAPRHTVTGLLWQKGWQGSRLPGIEIAADRSSADAAIDRVTLTGHLGLVLGG